MKINLYKTVSDTVTVSGKKQLLPGIWKINGTTDDTLNGKFLRSKSTTGTQVYVKDEDKSDAYFSFDTTEDNNYMNETLYISEGCYLEFVPDSTPAGNGEIWATRLRGLA